VTSLEPDLSELLPSENCKNVVDAI